MKLAKWSSFKLNIVVYLLVNQQRQKRRKKKHFFSTSFHHFPFLFVKKSLSLCAFSRKEVKKRILKREKTQCGSWLSTSNQSQWNIVDNSPLSCDAMQINKKRHRKREKERKREAHF